MNTFYPAIIFRQEAEYTVVFPDLDGVSTCGDTLENAFEQACDLLDSLAALAWMDGNRLPSATEIQPEEAPGIAADFGLDPARAQLVMVPVEPGWITIFEES